MFDTAVNHGQLHSSNHQVGLRQGLSRHEKNTPSWMVVGQNACSLELNFAGSGQEIPAEIFLPQSLLTD